MDELICWADTLGAIDSLMAVAAFRALDGRAALRLKDEIDRDAHYNGDR